MILIIFFIAGIIIASGAYNLFFWSRVGKVSNTFDIRLPGFVVPLLQIGIVILTLSALMFVSFLMMKPA